MSLQQNLFKVSTIFFPPRKHTMVPDTCISTLLCHDHVGLFIYAVQSFMHTSSLNLPLFVIDDGSLTKKDTVLLHHFFKITIINTRHATRVMQKKLHPYKHLYKFRFTPWNEITRMKLDAYLMPPYKRIIYMDSDVLFFQKPKEIEEWITKKHNYILHLDHSRSLLQSHKREDIDFSFREILRLYTTFKPISPTFNTGIVCIPNIKLLDLKKLNEIYALFNTIFYARAFTCEETSIAIVLADTHHKTLSPDTYICPAREKEYKIAKRQKNIKAIHYINENEKFYQHDAYMFLWQYIRTMLHKKII